MTLEIVIIATVAFIVGIFVRQLLPAYLAEKGKNLATREDIAEITTKVEGIRSDYSLALQRQAHQDQVLRDLDGRTHSLRLVAAEKRLAVLQESYVLWKNLVLKVHRPDAELSPIVIECQEWWNANCLYLDEPARQAFFAAYNAAANHKELLSVRPRTNEEAEHIKENWKFVVDAGAAILATASLPPMSTLEARIAGLEQTAMGTT